MTYEEFKAYMAKYGFPACPITEEQFDAAMGYGLHVDDFYGMACDVNAGVDFHVACQINDRRLNHAN